MDDGGHYIPAVGGSKLYTVLPRRREAAFL
jgi:hypothetical protein